MTETKVPQKNAAMMQRGHECHCSHAGGCLKEKPAMCLSVHLPSSVIQNSSNFSLPLQTIAATHNNSFVFP